MQDTDNIWRWRTAGGEVVTVEPTQWPDDFDWYPEGPGQRMPQFYTVGDRTFPVFPLEPWSPAEALSDLLTSWGWEDLTPQPETLLCDHGLSLDLCSGPNHYGEEW